MQPTSFPRPSTLALTPVLLAVALLLAPAPAQPGPAGSAAVLTGQVYDSGLAEPVEYANIVVYRLRDSTQVNGTISRPDGRFEVTGLPPGRYYIEVSFIGYRPRTVTDVQLAPGARRDIGRIDLRQIAVAVEGAEAVADRPTFSYHIDKKVIEVGRQAAAVSGTAVDIIENAPAVKVDVEGNVTLRGSGNFTVLIDGRPTLLEPDEALQQTPASSLERVEIITNPSAKFDPEGAAGIINLILKQQRRSGLSGQASATAGLWGRYGGDLMLNWRTGIASFILGADYNRRASPGTRTSAGWTAAGADTTWSHADGSSNWGGQFGGARAGVELQWSAADRTILGSRFGLRANGRSGATEFTRWTTAADTARYSSADSSTMGGNHLAVNAEHRHRFAPPVANGDAHELSGRVEYSRRGHDAEAVTTLADSSGALTYGWKTMSSGPGDRWGVNLDYVLPLEVAAAAARLEAGYSAGLGGPRQTSAVEVYDPDSGRFIARPEHSYGMKMVNDVHALYSTWTGELGPLGYKAGLRGEHNRRVMDTDSGPVPTVSTLDLFPTAHLSWRLPARVELMASYARRIRRPRGWELFPFLAWQDAWNVRRGNPNLLPERINAIEAGATLPFGANRVSLEAYLRATTDLIERTRSVYAPEVILHTMDNVGRDRSLGIELSSELVPFKWWTINLTATTYDYRIESDRGERASFNWSGRIGNEFRLPTNTRLQLNAGYESPSVTSQGRTEGFLRTDAGIRQQFFGRRLSVALSARDLLGMARHDFTSGGPGYDFYSHDAFRRAWPMASLSLTWNFNDFRLDRRQRPEDNGDDDIGGGEEG
jgi:outer membrane receptor protein involved in Fe transport